VLDLCLQLQLFQRRLFMTYIKTALILSSACTLLACTPSPAPEADTSMTETMTQAEVMPDSTAMPEIEAVVRDIKRADGTTLGTVSLMELAKAGTEVTISISGLDGAGTHAIHFHEIGLCEAPGFTSSGGHFNPTNVAHGTMSSDGPHAGDMMNIEVADDGSGTLTIINERVSINGDFGLSTLNDDDGTALIIHEKADDYKTQPTGAAGGRIGCAVLY
jgi:Cu-Zn family superoxide dismutase